MLTFFNWSQNSQKLERTRLDIGGNIAASAIFPTNQYCQKNCQLYCWISNIAKNITGNIADSAIHFTRVQREKYIAGQFREIYSTLSHLCS